MRCVVVISAARWRDGKDGRLSRSPCRVSSRQRPGALPRRCRGDDPRRDRRRASRRGRGGSVGAVSAWIGVLTTVATAVGAHAGAAATAPPPALNASGPPQTRCCVSQIRPAPWAALLRVGLDLRPADRGARSRSVHQARNSRRSDSESAGTASCGSSPAELVVLEVNSVTGAGGGTDVGS